MADLFVSGGIVAALEQAAVAVGRLDAALAQRVARRRRRQRRPHSPLLIMRRGRSSGGRAFG